MNYEETLKYLYKQLPVFQQIGSAAYKPGLQNTEALDKYFGYPHRKFHTIHVAGTNGKGSVSHLLAAILQLNGYKTGLYTSPHLIDFRERIRINGKMISKEDVIQFAEKHLASTLHIQPSKSDWAEDWTVQISLLLIYVSLPISAMTMCKCSETPCRK